MLDLLVNELDDIEETGQRVGIAILPAHDGHDGELTVAHHGAQRQGERRADARHDPLAFPDRHRVQHANAGGHPGLAVAVAGPRGIGEVDRHAGNQLAQRNVAGDLRRHHHGPVACPRCRGSDVGGDRGSRAPADSAEDD